MSSNQGDFAIIYGSFALAQQADGYADGPRYYGDAGLMLAGTAGASGQGAPPAWPNNGVQLSFALTKLANSSTFSNHFTVGQKIMSVSRQYVGTVCGFANDGISTGNPNWYIVIGTDNVRRGIQDTDAVAAGGGGGGGLLPVGSSVCNPFWNWFGVVNSVNGSIDSVDWGGYQSNWDDTTLKNAGGGIVNPVSFVSSSTGYPVGHVFDTGMHVQLPPDFLAINSIWIVVDYFADAVGLLCYGLQSPNFPGFIFVVAALNCTPAR